MQIANGAGLASIIQSNSCRILEDPVRFIYCGRISDEHMYLPFDTSLSKSKYHLRKMGGFMEANLSVLFRLINPLQINLLLPQLHEE